SIMARVACTSGRRVSSSASRSVRPCAWASARRLSRVSCEAGDSLMTRRIASPFALDKGCASSARSATRAGRVQLYRRANQTLQCLLVDLLALVEVDGPSGGALEARVEEARRVFEGGPPGERHLHHVLVRLAGADQSVVRPHRNPSPLPLLDHVGVGLLDQCAELGEHLAPPVAQLLDPLVYQLRRRLSFLGPALPHDVSFFPFLLFLA